MMLIFCDIVKGGQEDSKVSHDGVLSQFQALPRPAAVPGQLWDV